MPLKKLKTPDGSSAEKLIHAIEKKDRRFRLFQTLFMVVTFIGLIIIISAQQNTLNGVHEQQKQAEKVALDTAKRSQDQQDKIIRRLDCMVAFFSKKDRSNLSINNIDRCTLNRDKDTQQFFEDPESTPSQQPSSLNNGSSSQGGTNQALPATPNNSGDDEQNDDKGNSMEQRPPVLLDLPIFPSIPLCVPFTSICIR